MVERQAVGDPAAPVVADHREPLEAQLPHHQQLVTGHGPLGVRGVRGVRRRLVAVAIAAQVGEDHGVGLGQARGDVVPDGVGLGVAVQQQGRAGPSKTRGRQCV